MKITGWDNMSKLNLEVNGFGSVNEANIDLNKINIVGGVNSSGKSGTVNLLVLMLVFSDYFFQFFIYGLLLIFKVEFKQKIYIFR